MAALCVVGELSCCRLLLKESPMSAVRPILACALMGLHAHASDLDGYDELVYGIPGQNGKVVDRHGTELGAVGGR